MKRKSRDTRSRARVLIDAYIEALVGLFALRLDSVKVAVRADAPVMTVMSSYDGEHLNLQSARVVDELSSSSSELRIAVEILTGAFVTSMWDLLTSHANYETIAIQPEIQYFRHLRNACGHDGRWNFTDLRHPAAWRDKQLDAASNGKRVFDSDLKTGDVVLLFLDIERKYFEQ